MTCEQAPGSSLSQLGSRNATPPALPIVASCPGWRIVSKELWLGARVGRVARSCHRQTGLPRVAVPPRLTSEETSPPRCHLSTAQLHSEGEKMTIASEAWHLHRFPPRCSAAAQHVGAEVHRRAGRSMGSFPPRHKLLCSSVPPGVAQPASCEPLEGKEMHKSATMLRSHSILRRIAYQHRQGR